jgi:omega-amidase
MNLKVSLAQVAIENGNIRKNIEMSERMIASASKHGSSMVIFPEMWTTGFSKSPNFYQKMEQSQVLFEIGELAKKYQIWVAGSMPFFDKEPKPSNSLLVFNSLGKIVANYEKIHLFRPFGEEKLMNSGKKISILSSPWGKIGLSICYDLRFGELYRALALQGAELIIISAAFPHPRLSHWRSLLQARAIENQLFILAVNRVGEDDFSGSEILKYFGGSCLIDPNGQIITEANENESLLTASIDITQVAACRSRITYLEDLKPEVYTRLKENKISQKEGVG